MTRWLTIGAFSLLAIAPPLRATDIPYDFKVLIDADGASSTGCAVTLPGNATFAGTDLILKTTVLADDITGLGKVTGIAASPCLAGAFGPYTALNAGQWSARGPNLVVETAISRAQLVSLMPAGFAIDGEMRLAFVATPVTGTGGDSIVVAPGPSLFPQPSPRRRAASGIVIIQLDGKPQDWGTIAPHLPIEGSFRGGIRLVGAYATSVGQSAYFRFDASVGGTFRSVPDAFPRTGPAPLTVTFVTKAEASGVQIFRYRWDFEGDGVFDTDDPGERDYTRTFTTPGIRNALLQVTNDKNQTATAAVQINVTGAPPTASAVVTPSNGAVPLNVTLTGTATRGTAPIAKYEWDFQGDGIYDFSSTTTGNTTFRYATPGTYNAVFRVTDTAGLQSTARATATAVRVGPPGSPTANITVPSSPVRQNAPAVISFAGTGTTPAGTITKYEWDFEGDGTYDFSSPSNASTTHIYTSPGVYTASLRVTNSAGLTGIDTVDIGVDILVTLQLSTDTLRPPDTVTVKTFLGGTAPVTIFIKNKSGQTVRTLVNNVTRVNGNYSDSWDGKADNGAFVAEGAYYVVLKFLANGNPFFVDLTNTTGNQFYNPVWSLATTKGGSCFDCPFAPYENNFLQATFTLTEASEVSVSIRGYDTVNEVARLIDQRPFGRGKPYIVVWEGTDANGKLVDPTLYNDSQFIFGLTATTLPDNAIVVELAPEITQVSVTPNYYDPYTTDFLTPQKPTATVSYTLSKPSTVRLQVYRTGTNVLLRTIDRPNAPAGAGAITWDGRDDKGIFADKGEYRLSVKAIDPAGNQSLVRYALMKVFY